MQKRGPVQLLNPSQTNVSATRTSRRVRLNPLSRLGALHLPLIHLSSPILRSLTPPSSPSPPSPPSPLSITMGLSLVEGFTKSLAMTVLSEIGDKTFFAAAILAMRYPRRYVLAGCLLALIVMTIFSAVLGWAAPNLISRKWTHHITTLLFFGFGLWSLWEGFTEKGDDEELAEVEAKLDAEMKASNGAVKTNAKADDDLKKKQRPFLSQFFSPILLKAFSITFFGEWGDKSQIATIGLAADENPYGVVLGGIIGQTVCTIAAVLGGKSLASQISERMVALAGGLLFIVFGVQSLLSTA